MNNRVDIIVPVYNEKENFSALYAGIAKAVRSDWRLLLIYDFPQDSTLEVAEPISQQDNRVQLVRNASKGALGAIKTGFDAAAADAVLMLLADDPPEIIARIDALVATCYKTHADIVVASRYMKGGAHIGGPLLKGILSRLAGVSLYWAIGLPTHDATYVTRLYQKSFLESVTIESQRGFEVTLELTIKGYLAGKKIVEIPVVWRERTVGVSKFQLRKWLPAYLRWFLFGLKNHYRALLLKKSANAART
ncbi:MAG: glycosyltransferase [Patescibacteria group bacterium]|nr:glycosyltransferase [Patescibacteria group bacterium]